MSHKILLHTSQLGNLVSLRPHLSMVWGRVASCLKMYTASGFLKKIVTYIFIFTHWKFKSATSLEIKLTIYFIYFTYLFDILKDFSISKGISFRFKFYYYDIVSQVYLVKFTILFANLNFRDIEIFYHEILFKLIQTQYWYTLGHLFFF